jgi:hypothetical protein
LAYCGIGREYWPIKFYHNWKHASVDRQDGIVPRRRFFEFSQLSKKHFNFPCSEIDFPKLQTIIAETAKLGQNTGINEGELRRISFNQIAGLSDAKQRLIEIFIWPSKVL